jgi:hypothetical protein
MALNLNIAKRHNNIYLIYLSTIAHTGQKIYKFGKTYDCLNRFRGYPKDSTLLFFTRVKDCHHVETEIYNVFKDKFIQKNEIGREYFEGDPKIMINYINQIINHMNQRENENMLNEVKTEYKTYLRFTIYDSDVVPDNLSDELLDNYNNIDNYVINISKVKSNTNHKTRLKIDPKVKLTKEEKILINNNKILISRLKTYNFREGIIEADDVNDQQYEEYIDRYNNNPITLTEPEMYLIERYLYIKYWNINIIDNDFLNNWFRKTYVLYNLRQLKGITIADDLLTIDKHKDVRYLNYDKTKQSQRIEYIRDLVKIMGFGFDNIGKNSMISKIDFETNKIKSLEICKIFTNPVKSETLFDFKINKLHSNKAFIGFINTLLQHYGLCIKVTNRGIWDKKNKKKTNTYNYTLEYFNNINNYI